MAREKRARVFVLALTALAVSALFLLRHHQVSWSRVLPLAVLFWICASLSTRAGARVTVSTGFVVGMAGVLLAGPLGAGFVGLADGLMYARSGQTPIRRAFNSVQFCLAGIASGLVFELGIWGHGARLSGHLSAPRLLLATAAVTVTYYFVNNVLVSLVVSIAEGVPLRTVWWDSIAWSSSAYFAYGLLGLLMAVLWVQVSIIAGALVLVPILVARQTFAHYAAEREEYDATVRALIQAVETKDYYTRGHSERVSRATVLIAREWGLREDRVNVIRYAGLLHDIGKLGVPTKVLQKQGKLNDSEFDAIKMHPMRGYEMLREITFLEEALTGVVHHHERMDGRGYPMGLVANEIPEFARIIMVADAFDSMTSTRSYRAAKSVEEAVAELRKWQGQQFDPAAVDALVRALEKNVWEPHPEPFHGELVARDGTLLPRPDGVRTPSAGPRRAS
jgi:putative nucleotidyltransferase with HDIG domain